MRWVSCLVLAVSISCSAAAEERPDDIIKAAIAAAGGEEALAKFPAGRLVGKGTMSFAGVDTPFTFEQAYHIPGRFRTTIRCEVKGQKWELNQIVNDTVAKQTINGRTIPLSEAAIKELQIAVLLNEIGQLSTLTTDKKFAVKLYKHEKNADPGVLVQVKGFPEIRLGFDRKSGLLVRTAYKTVDADTSKDVDVETTFDDFKAASGLTRPTRCTVIRDGKKVIDMKVEKFTPLDKIDSKAFTLDE